MVDHTLSPIARPFEGLSYAQFLDTKFVSSTSSKWWFLLALFRFCWLCFGSLETPTNDSKKYSLWYSTAEPLYTSAVADFPCFFWHPLNGRPEVERRSRVCHMESTQSLPMLCQHRQRCGLLLWRHPAVYDHLADRRVKGYNNVVRIRKTSKTTPASNWLVCDLGIVMWICPDGKSALLMRWSGHIFAKWYLPERFLKKMSNGNSCMGYL